MIAFFIGAPPSAIFQPYDWSGDWTKLKAVQQRDQMPRGSAPRDGSAQRAHSFI
jgi:hypothetical protein